MVLIRQNRQNPLNRRVKEKDDVIFGWWTGTYGLYSKDTVSGTINEQGCANEWMSWDSLVFWQIKIMDLIRKSSSYVKPTPKNIT
mmetsp:Transcript_19121/g.47570  ORF Transcript_19121/g.47570 Transcript_19121/m.47570 type:complete len:85 (-) Transcript_19121:4702-4956(-)